MSEDLSQLNQLQDFLERSIPSVKDLRFQLVSVSPEEVTAKAPLIENSNHMGTAFGGSLYSILVLTCYSWLYSAVTRDGIGCQIVIQTGHIDYQLPVNETIQTSCLSPGKEQWRKFCAVLEKKGRARLILQSRVIVQEESAATLTGTFVVFKN